jgi:hypothetical protein
MADVKYPDYTPVDEPVRTGPKPAEPGSDIRVDGKPVKPTSKKDTDPLGEAADNTMKMIARKRAAAEEAKKSKVNAMGDTYAKGGMTASKRADGCCTKGKTRGKMM